MVSEAGAAFMTSPPGAGSFPAGAAAASATPRVLREQFVDQVTGLHPVERPDTAAKHLVGEIFDVDLLGVVFPEDPVD